MQTFNLSKRHRRLLRAIVMIACLLRTGTAFAESPLRGKILFLRCASCHDISQSPSPKIGPNLYGVVGRPAGSLAGYAYSPAMKSQTFVWDEDHLNRWLTNPADLVPGTAMAFGGIPDEADRKAVIAYLRKAGK